MLDTLHRQGSGRTAVDCMFSADLMVSDTVKTATALVDRLGLPPMRPTWTDVGRTLDELVYLRAYHPISAAAPTNIEIICGDLYPKLAMAPAAWGRQTEGRPVQTHATVLITKDYGGFLRRLQKEHVRHYDMPDPGDGLGRCWFGVESLAVNDPANNDYDPSSDGGIFLEVISWEGTAIAARPPVRVRVPAGGFTRVVARTYLVPDIDWTMASLRRALAWPDPAVAVEETDELRYAVLRPSMPESAVLELVQPKGSRGRHGEFFAAWGAGPHAIRLGVAGLAARADNLSGRGTPFVEATTPNGETALLVEGDVLEGAIVEIVEDGSFAEKV